MSQQMHDHAYAELLAQHADCDWNTRIDSGLEELDPAGVRRVIQEAERPVVIKFGKHHCGWTKKLNRALQVLVPRYRDRADFFEANLPAYPELYEEWNLPTSPMMLLFEGGVEKDRSDAAEDWEAVETLQKWFGKASSDEAADA